MIGFSIIILLLLVTAIKAQLFQYEPYNYCDPKLKLCDLPTDHTMCKFPVSMSRFDYNFFLSNFFNGIFFRTKKINFIFSFFISD